MKKGLFFSALLFLSGAAIAQNLEDNSSDSRFIEKIKSQHVSPKEQTQINNYLAKQAVQNAAKVQGGMVDASYDFVDIVYQLYSANLSSTLVAITPDSTTIFGYDDGTQTNTVEYTNNTTHGIGNVLDVNFVGFPNGGFAEADMVTIDSVFVSGLYFLLNSNKMGDKLRFTLFNSDQPNDAAFGGVYWQPGTFPNMNPADTANATNFTYAGTTAHGIHDGLKAETRYTFERTFVAADTTGGVQTFGVATPGVTFDASRSIGVFVEFIPATLTTQDTCNLLEDKGTMNAFRSLALYNSSSADDNAYFLDFVNQTNNNSMNFLFASTRYMTYTGTSAWRNDYTNVNPLFAHNIWYRVSGTSTSGTEELANDLDYTIYPNPSNGNFSLEFGDVATEGEYTVRVLNIIGQEVSSEVINITSNTKVPFNLSNVEKGMYILNISGNGSNSAHRITIQ